MKRLSRASHPAGDPRPIRVVHLGAGAFHRAHAAWYTAHAGAEWGIAAVAPRSDGPLRDLGPQDGLYTLLTRDPAGDDVEIVPSISRVLAGADPAWLDLVADPQVTVVTVTVTEAGYGPTSAILERLAGGLERRRHRGGGPIAVVSCDNLAGNGPLVRERLLARAGPALAAYLQTACSFPSTVVDRITPATTAEDLDTVGRLIGLDDRAAVVTEPFHEWILEDTFQAARPGWEQAGARLVDDIGPYVRRKLRLLNGGHSVLAYLGGALGHRWVHEAVADPVALDAVVAYWSETIAYLEARERDGLDVYCAGVEERWRNRRLPHALAQIAADGSTKLAQRVVPTILAARATGAFPTASAGLLGAWVAHLRGTTAFAAVDSRLDALRPVATAPLADAVRVALGVIDSRLGDDRQLCAEVASAAGDVERRAQAAGGTRR